VTQIGDEITRPFIDDGSFTEAMDRHLEPNAGGSVMNNFSWGAAGGLQPNRRILANPSYIKQ